jgi:hypothetical protein
LITGLTAFVFDVRKPSATLGCMRFLGRGSAWNAHPEGYGRPPFGGRRYFVSWSLRSGRAEQLAHAIERSEYQREKPRRTTYRDFELT